MPTKICFIIISGNPVSPKQFKGSKPGGAELNLFFLAEELSQKKIYDISCITTCYNQKLLQTHKHNIKIFQVIPTHNIGLIQKIYKLFSYLQLFYHTNADIYIQSSFSQLTFVLALFCKLFGKKFIYRISHDRDTINDHLKNCNPLPIKLFNLSMKWANMVVAQTKKQKKELEYFKKIKSVVIKNIYKTSGSVQPNNISKDIILWVSRGVSWKRPELFVKLAQSFPNKKFIMIMPKKNINLWLKIKKETELMHNIKLINFISYKKIILYFRRAMIFVNTSDYEGFPNTFLQAAACRTPIVSLNVNPDNFLNEYRCGFCANNNFNQLITLLQFLLCNKNFRKKMGDNGLFYLKKQHDLRKNIKKWEKIINDLQNKN